MKEGHCEQKYKWCQAHGKQLQITLKRFYSVPPLDMRQKYVIILNVACFTDNYPVFPLLIFKIFTVTRPYNHVHFSVYSNNVRPLYILRKSTSNPLWRLMMRLYVINFQVFAYFNRRRVPLCYMSVVKVSNVREMTKCSQLNAPVLRWFVFRTQIVFKAGLALNLHHKTGCAWPQSLVFIRHFWLKAYVLCLLSFQ